MKVKIYTLHYSSGFKATVNANSMIQAHNSLVAARVVSAPKSAIKSYTVRIKTIEY